MKLFSEIIDLSESKVWDEAKNEWVLEEIRYLDPKEEYGQVCLCGHKPIYELCYLTNIKNHNSALVGNVCVKKFMEQDHTDLFNSIKNIKEFPNRAMKTVLLEYCKEHNLINNWEYDFYKNTKGYRSMTTKRMETRRWINKAVVFQLQKLFDKQKQ